MDIANNKPPKIKKRPPPVAGFVKGKSGNPSGRAKLTPEELDLRQACKDRTPAALAVIETLMMEGEKEQTKLQAATFIIERAYGKAIQPTDVTGQLQISQIIRKIVDPKNG